MARDITESWRCVNSKKEHLQKNDYRLWRLHISREVLLGGEESTLVEKERIDYIWLSIAVMNYESSGSGYGLLGKVLAMRKLT